MRKINVCMLMGSLMVLSSLSGVHAASSITYLTNVGNEDFTGSGIKEVSRVVKCDLDGSGKSEEVTFKAIYNNGKYTSLSASVNGEDRTLVDNLKLDSNDGFDVCLVKMAKNRSYLQVLSDDNNDKLGFNTLYRYHSKTKTFKKVVSLLADENDQNRYEVYDGSIYNVKATSFKVKSVIEPLEVGYIGLNISYTYKKGALVRNHTTSSFTGDTKLHYVTSKALTLTKSRTSKKMVTIKKNTTVTLTKAYVKDGDVSLCFKAGKKSGWKKVSPSKNKTIKDVWFKNTKNNFM